MENKVETQKQISLFIIIIMWCDGEYREDN